MPLERICARLDSDQTRFASVRWFCGLHGFLRVRRARAVIRYFVGFGRRHLYLKTRTSLAVLK
ncbi:Hypothetical protein FKW44_020707, partial [Caligus rogercresseyi]